MIVKNKMKGIATKKGNSWNIQTRRFFKHNKFLKLFKEELLIRLDNGQSIF